MQAATKFNTASSGSALAVLKATVLALLLSLVMVLLSAFALKIFNIDNSMIPMLNQFIKGLSILIACLICLRGAANGWLKGMLVGILYIPVAFAVFSLLNGEFVYDISLLNDIALGSVSGLLSGIICANIRTRT